MRILNLAQFILILTLTPFAFSLGVDSSGGGMPPSNIVCGTISESIENGFYQSTIQTGIGRGDSLLLDTGTAILSLEGLNGANLNLQLIGGLSRTGEEFSAFGKIKNTNCHVQIEVKRYACEGVRDEMVAVEMPFWLSEFAFDPATYNYDCKSSIAQNQNNATSSRILRLRK